MRFEQRDAACAIDRRPVPNIHGAGVPLTASREPTGIDAERGPGDLAAERQVRRRESDRAATLVTAVDGSRNAEAPPEQGSHLVDSTGSEPVAHERAGYRTAGVVAGPWDLHDLDVTAVEQGAQGAPSEVSGNA